MRLKSLGIGLLLCVAAASGHGKGGDISTGGMIVADSGFRSKPNGFRFESTPRANGGTAQAKPAEGDYRVNLLGAAQQALTDITFVSPGRVLNVAGLEQAPGQVDRFRIGGGAMSYTAGSAKSPVFKFATDNPKGDDALYTLSDAATTAGKGFTVKLARKSSVLSFASEGEASGSMVIRAMVAGEKGKREFTFDQVKTDLRRWGKLKLDSDGEVKLKLNKEGNGGFSKFWGEGK